MRTGILLALCLSGCTMSFQPFPASVSAPELVDALKVRDKNIVALAKALEATDQKVVLLAEQLAKVK